MNEMFKLEMINDEGGFLIVDRKEFFLFENRQPLNFKFPLSSERNHQSALLPKWRGGFVVSDSP